MSLQSDDPWPAIAGGIATMPGWIIAKANDSDNDLPITLADDMNGAEVEGTARNYVNVDYRCRSGPPEP